MSVPLQVVAEVVRLLLQAISLAGSQSPDTEQDLMAVLLSVLIQDIAPHLSATPALRELAVKLVTQIASGSMSVTFKAVAAKLSPQHKQRLQVTSDSMLPGNTCCLYRDFNIWTCSDPQARCRAVAYLTTIWSCLLSIGYLRVNTHKHACVSVQCMFRTVSRVLYRQAAIECACEVALACTLCGV